mgnify:FL=1
MTSRLTTFLTFAAFVAVTPLHAQDAALATYFKDKTVTIGVGSSTGGGLDTFSRLVSRHLGKHIPGNPADAV